MIKDIFMSLIYELFRTLDARDRNASACYGVTRLQGFVLMELMNAGDLSMQELAQKMQLSMSTMTRVLDKIVAAGLVKRANSSNDRRIVVCTLTGKGKTTSRKLEECYNAFFSRIVSELSPSEQKIFVKTVQKTINNIKEDYEVCR